jgi:hypothetical protein
LVDRWNTLAVSDLQQQSATFVGYGLWIANTTVVAGTVVTVCLCVLLHYEMLNLLSRWMIALRGRKRRRVLFAIFGLLSVHVAEIWIFGVAFALMLLSPSFGAGHGVDGRLLDYVYVSAMIFSTVGTADAYLTGPVRFLAGTEALTGLLLITWSASFTFLEMQRFWRNR